MKPIRKQRFEFRPMIDGAALEDRQLLAAGASTIFDLGGGVTVVVPPTPPSASTLGTPISAQAARQLSNLNSREIRQFQRAFLTQARATSRDLRQLLSNRATQLFALGSPTAQQLSDFNAFANGALNATAFRLSGQAALLPTAGNRLVGSIQNSLLGSGQGSLLNRLQAQALAGRNTGSLQALQTAINQQVNRAFTGVNSQLNNFFRTTPLNRLSVDPSGQPIQFQQFLGNQVISQFGNTLGALAQSFPTVGSSVLFPNGSAASTLESQQAFAGLFQQALGTAAFQLGNNLSLFPGAATSLASGLQTGFFGTDVTNPSLFGTLSNLPVNSVEFPAATTGLFSSNFSNIISPLTSFFGIPSSQTFRLPTGTTTGVFGTSFTGTDFFDGFNGGFGSGFTGFGTAPTTFNTSFGTGFNDLISGSNTAFGFAPPSLGPITAPPSLGGGTGVGTGTGGGTGTTF